MRVKGGPAMVYSSFNTVEGAGIFSKVLKAHGFLPFTEKTWDGINPFEDIPRYPRYAFVKGGMDANFKAKIMKVFNSRANAHGQIIRVMFVTQAASEGISLYHLRQIHIMEPFWNNMLIEQVIGRGFRLRSHKYLADKAEREIQIFHYYAVNEDNFGIDMHVQDIADRKSQLINKLKPIRAAASIDCTINRDYNVALGLPCLNYSDNPTGLAFTTNISNDIKMQKSVQQRTLRTTSCKTFIHQLN
jgi:hypothetical protein